jgi:diguanylate cyclase (GGDEF)-like protein
MRDKRFYLFLHRQIPVVIALSLFPGLGYVFLGWLNHILAPAFIWYLLAIAESVWGYSLYRKFNFDVMSDKVRDRWYRHCSWFYYSYFLLWVLIFLLYVGHDERKLHYIAIFTELGASVVASTLLASDKKLFKPIIFTLMIPLIIYFALIGEWYGYVLTIFACTLTWVLLYASKSSYHLLKQANHQANHDALTQLFNRHFFIEHLQRRLNTLNESGEYTYIQLIDLDHFKNVNDSLGHDVGDLLLQNVVSRLLQHIPAECVIARLGGDEFIISGPKYSNRNACLTSAVEISELLVTRLKEVYLIEQHQLYISASIGISVISGSTINANEFIKEADIAMYEVKARGRDGVFVFNKEISNRVERYLEIEHHLHTAILNNEITLHYQPQINREGKVIGVESLARWHNPLLGNIPPDQFIRIAEQTGLIIELGYQLLEIGLSTLREWYDEGNILDQFSINISMRQLTHHQFAEQIENLLLRHFENGQCNKLVFEITESIAAEDIEAVILVINRLKKLGIRFSMDDFGTGYSSLAYLSRLPLDELKIDCSFVNSLDHNEHSKTMVITIINMAKIFNLKIVAEGVETLAQLNFLLNTNTNIFQGNFYSKPLTKEQFESYFRDRNQ